MPYILDSNILIHKVRDSVVWRYIQKKYFSKGVKNNGFISVVSIGETRSFAKQGNWGKDKTANLINFIGRLQPIPIKGSDVQNAYIEIDTYSQNKQKSRTLPSKYSARNMGKNDLWIAAVAHAKDFALISTDADFQHLDGVFFNFIYIDAAKIISDLQKTEENKDL